MSVLVDTSVWVDHFRRGSGRLAALLEEGLVVCHPFVVGELACGHLRNRAEILESLSALPRVETADHEEVLRFLDSQRLYGTGLGWIDAHLLASAVLSGVRLWTRDRRLLRAAERVGVRAAP